MNTHQEILIIDEDTTQKHRQYQRESHHNYHEIITIDDNNDDDDVYDSVEFLGNDEHQQNTEPDIIIIDDYSDVYSEDDDIYDSLAFWVTVMMVKNNINKTLNQNIL